MLRGVILCSAYFAFILAIAAIPIANAVSIYFVMPFFVAALTGPFLGEHVPPYRWAAIAAAFIGVMVNGLDVSHLRNGVYTVTVQGHTTQRLVIAR